MACSAFMAVHVCAGNILHGDLTAGNVLLSADDADFRGFTAKVPTHPCSALAPSAMYKLSPDAAADARVMHSSEVHSVDSMRDLPEALPHWICPRCRCG